MSLPVSGGGGGGIQPPLEISYTQITATPGKPAAVGFANGVNIISPAAITFDGVSNYLFEFFAPNADIASGNNLIIALTEGGVDLGDMSYNSWGGSVRASWRFVPTAGSHTYVVKQYNSGNFGFGIACGAGGAGAFVPAYLRVSKVV